MPAQPYLDPQQPAAQPNQYGPVDPYRDSTYHAPSQQSYADDQQAGQHNYFANAHQQWGVAGVEPCYDCNSCGVMGCEFDSEIPQFYLSGFGMAVDLRNLNSDSGTLLADNGGGFGLAIGQRQGRNLRTELEYAWRSNSILGFEDTNNSFDVTGKIKSQAGMANAYWEFVNFPSQSIKPYVGAGLGFARFDADLQDSLGSLPPERSKDSSFAYQFMGGINYQPTSYIDLFIEYRLFRTDSFQIETNSGFAADRYDYEANNLVGGIRWKF
jgi:opacity protein-like surface antigen